MYIYIYIYTYTNVCVYICIDIYIYIKCANSTWKRERQLVEVRWLEKECWLQLEESSRTWKSHRLPKCATWKNCADLNLSFLCGTLKKCADLNLTFFSTYLHPIPRRWLRSNRRPSHTVRTPPRWTLPHDPCRGGSWSWDSSVHPTRVTHKTIQTDTHKIRRERETAFET